MLSFPLNRKFYNCDCPITSLAVSASIITARFFHVRLKTRINIRNKTRRLLISASVVSGNATNPPSVVLDSLRVLQWDQLCDCVASFAGTSLGKQATKEQLLDLAKTYEDSVRLLEETNAAVEMNKYGAMMEFAGIDVSLVEGSLKCARKGFPVSGGEARALVALLQFAEGLQLNVKAAIKEDSDWSRRFMPLSEMILELVINRPLIKFIEQLVDEDGLVKDSASSTLRQAREKVRILERKLYQLLESLVRNETRETCSLEVCNVDGRWCINSGGDIRPSFEGLLLSSGTVAGSLVEPLSVVPLNDELQQARASVAKAEADVLFKITEKLREGLHDLENIFTTVVRIDLINARARYSLSFDGIWPELYLPQHNISSVVHVASDKDETTKVSQLNPRKWTLYLRKAHHPLLVQQHRQNLQWALKDLSNAKAEIRRKKQLGRSKKEEDLNIASLEMKVAELKEAYPVPFDIFIEQKTKVLVISGPNTGGKTICLKTVGLAAMMARSGLFVLASEPVMIPWFEFVLADIGDEQSLLQSLSTFSSHLKQISEIKSLVTSQSLVLLDEVGAGTNPLEGAALGMSLLESFADGALLTIATTHHGELKTLKYSNDAFENACMEFDEVNLKPTYRILWGVPGRSNAINIAERLGLPTEILDSARKLYGPASSEINEVIVDMERFKQDYHEYVNASLHYLRLSHDLHRSLLLTKKRLTEHGLRQQNRMIQEMSEAASSARSIIHKKVRAFRSIPIQPSQQVEAGKRTHLLISDNNRNKIGDSVQSAAAETDPSTNRTDSSIREKREIPKVGDVVIVPSLNAKAKVLKLDPSKEEIVVQAGNMKMKLKLTDVS